MGTQPTPDVVIVGAGVAGLTAAWYLTRAGATVTVVDPEPGAGASRAAAGMIAPVSEVVHQHHLMRTLTTASARMYPDFIDELESELGHPVGYRSTSTLSIAATGSDLETFADLAQVQAAAGMKVEQLTVRRARALEPALSPTFAGAFLMADDHQINPRELVASLIEALLADGHSSLVRQQVAAVIRDDHGKVTGVRCSHGDVISAPMTLLSPGVHLATIADLPEASNITLRPVYGDILRTKLRPGQPPLVTRTIRALVNGLPVYLVPRTNGEIVIGATEREDGFDGVEVDGVYRLLRDARVIVPGTADLELTEVLARARPGTPDDLPYLGRLSGVDGLVVSTGYSRHGVLLAPLGGRLAAELILGKTSPEQDATILTAVSPERTFS